LALHFELGDSKSPAKPLQYLIVLKENAANCRRPVKEYEYGASPTGAQVLKTRTIGEQTFYVVKLVFPRGDAASLLLGFNAEGKITGISLMSMAGD
jgi:hypothetical protein